MKALEIQIERVLTSLLTDTGQLGLSSKKMFGGVCFLLHGNMVGGVFKNGDLCVRCAKDSTASIIASNQDAHPMDFTKRVLRGFVRVDGASVLNKPKNLTKWLKIGLAVAQAAPRKSSKKAKTTSTRKPSKKSKATATTTKRKKPAGKGKRKRTRQDDDSLPDQVKRVKDESAANQRSERAARRAAARAAGQ